MTTTILSSTTTAAAAITTTTTTPNKTNPLKPRAPTIKSMPPRHLAPSGAPVGQSGSSGNSGHISITSIRRRIAELIVYAQQKRLTRTEMDRVHYLLERTGLSYEGQMALLQALGNAYGPDAE
ncbi:hypothetical protein SMMN14_03495 [Sphaerulina musiva]